MPDYKAEETLKTDNVVYDFDDGLNPVKVEKKETWFEFMARAKKNGLSPTLQEAVDKDNYK